MPTNYASVMKRLQHAINEKYNARILINKQQFYSMETERPITTYVIKKMIYNEETGRKTYIELFDSTSQIQCVLWLRDYWYELNGWEIPTDNEIWNEEKRKYQEKIEQRKSGRSAKEKDSI